MQQSLRSLCLFCSLLPLLLSVAIAIPSSTDPQLDHACFLIPQSPIQAERKPVLSSIRESLKESISHWFHFPSTQRLTVKYAKPIEASGLLYARYGDQMVLRFNVSTGKEASRLVEAADILFLDVWESSNDWIDVRIAQDVIPSLLGLLPETMRHAHTPLMNGNELVRAIADTYPSPQQQATAVGVSHRSYRFSTPAKAASHGPIADAFFDDYRPLSVITHWLQLMQSVFSTHAQMISVGKSSEGRDIWALRVGVTMDSSEETSSPRKTIVISGGSHSREWISTSTVNYIAHSLVTLYGHNREITELVEDFDWIFIPTLNPDGYLYSWNSDRLWRKNRQPTTLRFCRGLDLDRTYGFKWDGERASDNPCSETFAGAGPFEAIESKTFSEWALNETKSNNVTFVGLLDLHSYSEQIMYPYSFSCHEEPPNMEDLAEIGQGLAKAIRNEGHQNYKVIPACEGNVAVSGDILPSMRGGGGSLLDWFYHELNVKHAYQIKLRDKGSYGFLLPKHYILPTGVEGLSAAKFFGKTLSSLYFAQSEKVPTHSQPSQQSLR